MKIFYSEVPGHEGFCTAKWLNRNQVMHRFDDGITGFFRLVRRNRFGLLRCVGPDFHGIIRYNETTVESTALDEEKENKS